ncbi:hypothetical protein [Streptomyces sp. NPDC002328]|uniref:hypothetical protein n=1 Tax=Streptomyces sp. NPDC002328 TaxID=3364642 RepID=UPI003696E1AB
MTLNVPDRPTAPESPTAPELAGSVEAPRRTRRERGPSPWEADRVRPLTRSQVEDRLAELGDLYADTAGGDPWAWNRDRDDFLRGLAADLRMPGFALLVAETTVLTGCAYGFPVDDRGPWWRCRGLGGRLPGNVLRLAASGQLFAVSRIVVQPGVRTSHQTRDWNLARRLQRRLLADHDAAAGVTLVHRADAGTLAALRAWGWRRVGADALEVSLPASPWHVLVLGP